MNQNQPLWLIHTNIKEKSYVSWCKKDISKCMYLMMLVNDMPVQRRRRSRQNFQLDLMTLQRWKIICPSAWDDLLRLSQHQICSSLGVRHANWWFRSKRVMRCRTAPPQMVVCKCTWVENSLACLVCTHISVLVSLRDSESNYGNNGKRCMSDTQPCRLWLEN